MFHRLISVLTILLVLSISLSIYANEAQDFFDLGQSFYEQGKYQEAIDAFENALDLQPDWALVYSKLGQIYLQAGETDQAIQFFQE